MNVYDNLKRLNIVLPEPPPRGGVYIPINEFGDKFLYTSGFGAVRDGKPAFVGKAGDVSIEYAQDAARLCIVNILSAVEKKLGDLNKIKRVVKLLGFVASKDDFYSQPVVMNAASELLGEIFGENGAHARSAIGTNVLPNNLTVEIELIFELK
ncbi:MAG: RidA family protein [Deferribacteraceae bacterium]|jgi:enamine deaminase RidA (YjgF/YER057c/UK114 family)|nr:RidA family protein [Deferribacteraceae bacterium]